MYYLDSNGFILSSNTNTSSGYHGVVTDPGRFDWRAAINVPTQFRHYMPAENPVLILQSNNSIAHLANIVRAFYDKVDTIGWEAAIREVYRIGHGNWGLDIITSIVDLDLDRHGVALARVVNRLRRSVVIDNRKGEDIIRKVFFKKYLKELKKFGGETVLREMKILTVNEFSLRYGLPLS